METQHNAFLNSMHRSLRVALQGRVGNSAQRFPELSVSLLGSLDRSRCGVGTSFTEDLS
ncbi:hypothetical protein [Leptospira noguchii]|uniref:hypothetical protein n=1 Tax=Leptospira noguchii TaxID=28182 RepID=UPI001FB68169|nr:hypothetical protein [Leptospira noguchii]UOG32331.1 hypothetical protein MAL06_15765 [Leptospira noguchii]